MGTTFTTMHIHNAQNLTKARFKKAFTGMMKAKCFAVINADNNAFN